nr:immunoglobulin light chain junction region [Macaca mulatta]MOW00984.1 immunoglobulin light chain junction region [Macaca mulatta]MOW01643.1 immunoglobulin light chain junction region [Macaca mulatta]
DYYCGIWDYSLSAHWVF